MDWSGKVIKWFRPSLPLSLHDSFYCWLTGFLISVGLAAGVSVGTQKLGSFGLPFSDPERSLGLEEEEEEELVLELVVASSATLLTLEARVCVIGGRGGGMEWVWLVERGGDGVYKGGGVYG